MDGTAETGSGIPQNRENRLLIKCWSKRDPVHREGCGVTQNEGNILLSNHLRSKRGPVDREGCGVPQNGLLFDLLRSKRGSCSSGGVWRTAKRDSTGYCSSTVDFLQPPPATVHPPSTSSNLHQLLFIHGLLLIQPPPLLHRLLFNQPSTRGPIQPP